MKQICVTLLMSCLSLFAFSQRVNESWQTLWSWNFDEYNPPTANIRVDAAGTHVTRNIPSGSRFTIVDETTLADYYIVFFWRYPDAIKRANFNYETDGISVKYFLVLKRQLESIAKQIFNRYQITGGAVTFPFKYRPQSGKFETTFAIGGTVGFRWNPWRFNEHTFSLLGGVAASSAKVDKYSTDPAAGITDPSDRASVTFLGSLFYQGGRFQIGISAGIDNLLDNEIPNWRYQGRGWISFGLGVGLFSTGEIKSPGKN